MRNQISVGKWRWWVAVLAISALLISAVGSVMARETKKADPWADYRFLLGDRERLSASS